MLAPSARLAITLAQATHSARLQLFSNVLGFSCRTASAVGQVVEAKSFAATCIWRVQIARTSAVSVQSSAITEG